MHFRNLSIHLCRDYIFRGNAKVFLFCFFNTNLKIMPKYFIYFYIVSLLFYQVSSQHEAVFIKIQQINQQYFFMLT